MKSKSLITFLTVAALASGCSSMQHLRTYLNYYAPTEQDLATKAQHNADLYWLNHLDNIDTVAEINERFEHAPAEAEMLLDEQGLTKAEFNTIIGQIRGDDELNTVFGVARVTAETVQAKTLVARQ